MSSQLFFREMAQKAPYNVVTGCRETHPGKAPTAMLAYGLDPVSKGVPCIVKDAGSNQKEHDGRHTGT
jgi:hypothetical protein